LSCEAAKNRSVAPLYRRVGGNASWEIRTVRSQDSLAQTGASLVPLLHDGVALLVAAGCEVDHRTRPLNAHDHMENRPAADRGQCPRSERAVHDHAVASTEGPKQGQRYGSGETESGGDQAASPVFLSLCRSGVAEYCGPLA
jgi:hypothetical protein